jgi:hypothetical protein
MREQFLPKPSNIIKEIYSYEFQDLKMEWDK